MKKPFKKKIKVSKGIDIVIDIPANVQLHNEDGSKVDMKEFVKELQQAGKEFEQSLNPTR